MNVQSVASIVPGAVAIPKHQPFFTRVLTGVGQDLETSLTTTSLRMFEETPSLNPPRLPVITSALVDLTVFAPLSFARNFIRTLRG